MHIPRKLARLRSRYWPIACLLLLWTSSIPRVYGQDPQSAQKAQQAAPALIVTYVEAPAAKAAALAADLKAYAAQIENGPGKPRVTILQELGRPSRIAVLEHWTDVASPAITDAATTLVAKTQPDVLAPLDRRPNQLVTPPIAQAPPTAFHVLMHIDVNPGADVAQAALKAQRDAVLAAPGALGYEVAVWTKRPNHLAVHEVWASRKAYEDYAATPPARELRDRLAPLLGSPFDDRFYSALEP